MNAIAIIALQLSKRIQNAYEYAYPSYRYCYAQGGLY